MKNTILFFLLCLFIPCTIQAQTCTRDADNDTVLDCNDVCSGGDDRSMATVNLSLKINEGGNTSGKVIHTQTIPVSSTGDVTIIIDKAVSLSNGKPYTFSLTWASAGSITSIWALKEFLRLCFLRVILIMDFCPLSSI